MSSSRFEMFENKMRIEGLSSSIIRAFEHHYGTLTSGQMATIAETDIEPVTSLPVLEELPSVNGSSADLLKRTAVLKLNGGLGTSMGLEKAKSLLPVKDGLNFLDLIVSQITRLKESHGVPVKFLLLNSFSTQADTLDHLSQYKNLGPLDCLVLMQNKIPKVLADSFEPASWPQEPQMEWCPPGHGDLYPALYGSGRLDELLREGIQYLFVSNSDNLGATLDLRILQAFAAENRPFLMEVTTRTPADRKGGHLARRKMDGRLILREAAQCDKADEANFQNIDRHRFFNTNNLWINLLALKPLMEKSGGFLKLPVIRNAKTLDPRDKKSPSVFQLETAMGSALEVFEGAGAILVPRTRFAPVKATCDLVALRSDAYELTEEYQMRLHPTCQGQPPDVILDNDRYKLVDQLDALFTEGVPSLRECRQLTVKGAVIFDAHVVIKGKVTFENKSSSLMKVKSGVYKDIIVDGNG